MLHIIELVKSCHISFRQSESLEGVKLTETGYGVKCRHWAARIFDHDFRHFWENKQGKLTEMDYGI